jgi:hypothetical protein
LGADGRADDNPEEKLELPVVVEKERGGASECEVTDGAGGGLPNVEWVGDQARAG